MDTGEDEQGHDEFRALCMAVGFIVLNWTIAEQQMDNWVNVAFINCGGNALRRDGDIPRSFSQKANFLTDCFKKLSKLEPFKQAADLLVKRLRDAANLRNDLVHGGIVSLESTDGIYKFRKVQYEKENHAVEYFNFGPSDFSSLETELGNLIGEQIAFSERLASAFLAPPE